MFSPDGKWLAYMSNESGREEVYVRVVRGSEGKWQISTDGGDEPVWARNGRELFYRNGDKMMAVAVATQPRFQAGKPETLFEAEYARTVNGPSYDVAPDGRFVMMKAAEQESAPGRLHVVLGWFEELKRKAGAR